MKKKKSFLVFLEARFGSALLQVEQSGLSHIDNTPPPAQIFFLIRQCSYWPREVEPWVDSFNIFRPSATKSDALVESWTCRGGAPPGDPQLLGGSVCGGSRPSLHCHVTGSRNGWQGALGLYADELKRVKRFPCCRQWFRVGNVRSCNVTTDLFHQAVSPALPQFVLAEMKVITPEISWHGRDPVYGVDFQFLGGDIRRLATCGTDRHVRVSVHLTTEMFLFSFTVLTRTESGRALVAWSGLCDRVRFRAVVLSQLSKIVYHGWFHELFSTFHFNFQLWEINTGKDGKAAAEFLSNLTRHTKTVNCVRFSPDGKFLFQTVGDVCWNINNSCKFTQTTKEGSR